MKKIKYTIFTITLLNIISIASAALNLNIKIGQAVGSRMIEINKKVKADYDQDIIISSVELKNKFVISLKKFPITNSDGSTINPVQVDFKLLNESKLLIGRPQTFTSFYNRTAQFFAQSSGQPTDTPDINISLDFEEIN